MTLPMIKRQPRSALPVKGAFFCSSAPALLPSPWQGMRHKEVSRGCCTEEQSRIA